MPPVYESANFLQPLLDAAKIGDTVECPPSVTELHPTRVWKVTQTIEIKAGVSFHAGPNCIFRQNTTAGAPAFRYDGGTLDFRPPGTPDTAAARDELPTRIGGGMIIFGRTGHAASSCFEVRNARNVIIDGLNLCPKGVGIELDGFDLSRLHNVAIQPSWVRRLIASFGGSVPGAKHTTTGIRLHTDNWPAQLLDIEDLNVWGGTTAVECVQTRQPLALVTVRRVTVQDVRSDAFVVRSSLGVDRVTPVVQFLLEDVYAENLHIRNYLLRAEYVDHLVVKRVRAGGDADKKHPEYGNPKVMPRRVKLQNCQRVHLENIHSFNNIEADPLMGTQLTAINVEADGLVVEVDDLVEPDSDIKALRNYTIFGRAFGQVEGYSPHQVPAYDVDVLQHGVGLFADYVRRGRRGNLPPRPYPFPPNQLVLATSPTATTLVFSDGTNWFRVTDGTRL